MSTRRGADRLLRGHDVILEIAGCCGCRPKADSADLWRVEDRVVRGKQFGVRCLRGLPAGYVGRYPRECGLLRLARWIWMTGHSEIGTDTRSFLDIAASAVWPRPPDRTATDIAAYRSAVPLRFQPATPLVMGGRAPILGGRAVLASYRPRLDSRTLRAAHFPVSPFTCPIRQAAPLRFRKRWATTHGESFPLPSRGRFPVVAHTTSNRKQS